VSVALDSGDAERLCDCVARGGVAVFPTDTVYGICCGPDDEAAAQRLYELKGRPPAQPAAVMFFALDAALDALSDASEGERAVMQALLPGPVTLLLENRARRFAAACRTDPATLGLRVPALPECLRKLSAIDVPVMQSSANVSGEPDARTLAQVPAGLRAGVDLVLDGGELPGVSSTVLDLREFAATGAWHVLREGALGGDAVREKLREMR
jgi:L-threonylcarbamoyladenylate synthase